MKLSEAIRLGATMKPQAFYTGMRGDGSCALRAAADALSIPDHNGYLLNTPELAARYPFLDKNEPQCPECEGTCSDFMDLIFHLNDDHKWSRERIADLAELHEPLPEPTVSEERESPCLQK